MTLQTAAYVKIDRRPRKSPRRNGRHGVLEAMGIGWHTAPVIALRYGRDRSITGVLLLRALRKGLVERRLTRCECCGVRIYQWRRVRP